MLLPVVATLVFIGLVVIPSAHAQQVVNVTETEPCFFNETAGIHMWENCGVREDFLSFAILPWDWVMGGWFSMILVGTFSLMSYIKYHKAVYPMLIGTLFLPVSYFLFPDTFLAFAILMMVVGVGFIVIFIYLKQTKEW